MDNLEDEPTLILDSLTDLNSSSCENDSSNKSSIYLTACSELNQSFLNSTSQNSINEIEKRKRSSSSLDEKIIKKSTISTSSKIGRNLSLSKIRIKCNEIWGLDQRLNKNLYYNRIDDSDFEINIFISSLFEKIIDNVIFGKSMLTFEHYYHLERKKIQVEQNKTVCNEYRQRLLTFVIENKNNTDDLIWNELQRQTAERRLEDQIQIMKISEEDLESFSLFLEAIYEKYDLID